MERQLLGTDEGRVIERCRECRGHVVSAGDEFVCTSCGVVARKVEEEKFHLEIQIRAPGQLANRLGSYVGDRSDRNSTADFNGHSTVGFAKRISDNLGVDQTAWNCAAMIRRAADRLSIPSFARENAIALSKKMLADSRANGEPKRHRTSVPAISAYALLSACRGAGMDHVSASAILQTYADMGRRVTKSALLRLGTESATPLRPADPVALLRTVVASLQAGDGVARRLAKSNVEPGPYFRRVLQTSQAIVNAVRGTEEGRSPRTIAAGCVYIASREAGSKAVTQKDVAETMGIAEYTIREFVASVTQKVSRPLNAGGP
jgi:transcription initiation factor TFIIIB Brf1 subunit/transcription initiation factor TFIIB